MEIVRLEDIRFSYDAGETYVLDGVSLSVSEGEHVAIVGPNGCGKSTLAKIAAGLVAPDEGEVTLFGTKCAWTEIDGQALLSEDKRVNFEPIEIGTYGKVDADAYAEARKSIGYVFQDPTDQLITENVATEIAFAPQNLCFSVAEIDEMVALELDKAGLAELAERPLGELSGGEQQLVAVASAVACNPKLLVLDEPTAYLDSENSKHLMRMIEKLTDRCAILHITHKQEEIERASRVVTLGKLA